MSRIEVITLACNPPKYIFKWLREDKEIRDTEWDYIVREVERTLNLEELDTYIEKRLCNHSVMECCMISDWPLRAQALAEIGVI